MKRLSSLVLAFGLVAVLTCTANAVVVIGGSTKNGNLDLTYAQEIVPGFFLPKPQVWQNVGTRVITGPYEDEMSSEPWAGPAPTPVTTDGNLNPPHPEGCGGPDCAVFFKPFSGDAGTTNGAATGRLFQDNPAVPGMLYQLRGWAGAEANALMADATLSIRFLNGANADIGGATLSMLPTLFTPNGEPFNYKLYQVLAVAPAGAVTVRADVAMIGAMGNPAGGGQAFVVDDFSLQYHVPEPTTIVLGALGLVGMMGFARRR
jgi:hypothetical protein